MKRVVIDTNLFISYLISKGPTLSRLIEHWKVGSFLLVTSPSLMAELHEVMNRPRLRRYIKDDPGILYEIVTRDGLMVEGRAQVTAGRDPKDRIFLACALEGRADVIVSGDSDLLILGEFQGIPIMRVADFVRWLDQDDDTLPLHAAMGDSE